MKKSSIFLKILLLIALIAGVVFVSCSDKSNSIFEADSSACNSCGKCVEVCPVKAITMVNGKAVIDVGKCNKCGKCAIICPNDAIN